MIRKHNYSTDERILVDEEQGITYLVDRLADRKISLNRINEDDSTVTIRAGMELSLDEGDIPLTNVMGVEGSSLFSIRVVVDDRFAEGGRRMYNLEDADRKEAWPCRLGGYDFDKFQGVQGLIFSHQHGFFSIPKPNKTYRELETKRIYKTKEKRK